MWEKYSKEVNEVEVDEEVMKHCIFKMCSN